MLVVSGTYLNYKCAPNTFIGKYKVGIFYFFVYEICMFNTHVASKSKYYSESEWFENEVDIAVFISMWLYPCI